MTLSDPRPTVRAVEPLTDLEQQVLTFERGRWLHQGAKDEAVRKAFGLSRNRYEQLLTNLLDKPAAYAAEPTLVKRLRRLRDTRARGRRAG
jgi:DNA-directed RNA polymerase sigma subunit (sigma70/sigma32)